MKKTYILDGVQCNEKEYGILKAVVYRGTCPYCGWQGMSNRYGNFRRHRTVCGRRFTLLGKEKIFAEWIAEAKRERR